MAKWGFLTNHAHVLIQVARNPRSTHREIALGAGITERAAISMLQDLQRAGIVWMEREGRRNVKYLDAGALGKYRLWGASEMPIPETLIQATLSGLAQVASRNGLGGLAEVVRARPADAIGVPLEERTRRWGFLTTHALCLIYVTEHPDSTVREIALAVGVTERAAHSALQDLREEGIIECRREGRRNSYSVDFAHLTAYRREGTAPDLVPDAFVASLVEALLAIKPAG